MKEFGYTVQTNKSVDQAVAAVEKEAQANSFRVLHIHDVQATLKEKGFEREPFRIVEVCNSKFAHRVLQEDIDIGLFLPCKINVYTNKGKTFISGLRPAIMKEFFKNKNIDEVADEVETVVRKIVDSAK